MEYSDIHGMQFRNTLETIVDFIDEHPELQAEYDKALYSELQSKIHSVYGKKDKASTRKSINQMIKLGFVNSGLKGYHSLARKFLNADSTEDRSLIFSEVYYSCANFQSSVINDKYQGNPINFFIKTLMNLPSKELCRKEIAALMNTDISVYKKGFLSEAELNSQVAHTNIKNFEDRKYNQIAYFLNFLRYVPGISVTHDKYMVFYTEDDSLWIDKNSKRDPTLFRIMREKIKQESIKNYNGKVVCYFTKQEQKGLVVSHIVPSGYLLKKGEDEAAYDYENAILLEPNIDAYFDKHDMTFTQDGKPQYAAKVPSTFIDAKVGLSLDKKILTKNRKEYLKEHNLSFERKKQNKK